MYFNFEASFNRNIKVNIYATDKEKTKSVPVGNKVKKAH
jgi:hypothetical protein